MEWLNTNKEWIFSGIGVAGLAWLFTVIRWKAVYVWLLDMLIHWLMTLRQNVGEKVLDNSAVESHAEEERITLREQLGVRELKDIENHLKYSRLPNGIFGFLPTHLLPRPGAYGLRKKPGGTAQCEVVKDNSGQTQLILFVSDTDLIAVNVPTRDLPLHIHATPIKYKEYQNVISIPSQLIEEIDNREFPDGMDLLEITLRETRPNKAN